MAKEADEFIKELNIKKEREVNDIIRNTSLNNSNTVSANEQIIKPNDGEQTPTLIEHGKTTEKPDVVSLPEPRKPEIKEQESDNPPPVEPKQPTENEQKKKKKVKSKCGCIIS